MDINKLSSKIIGAAIEVHKTLGPGLLESAYEKCLCHELKLRGLSFDNQKSLPVVYSGLFFAFRRLSGKQKEKILWALCAFAVKYHLPWSH